MKLVLTIFGLMLVLVFGAVAVFDDSVPVSAGGPSPTGGCHDDGDDDLPSNPEPVDGPDEEDNLDEEVGEDERDEEHGDTEDEDPSYEEEDDTACDLQPTGVLGETGTPEPTCIPHQEEGVNADFLDLCLCPDTGATGPTGPTGPEDPCVCDIEQLGPGDPDCACIRVAQPCCSIFAGGEVDAEGFCYCDPSGTNCCPVYNNTCLCYNFPEFGDCDTGSSVYTADTDCDGEVTVTDAYQTLTYVSGVEESLGGDCGSGSPGDADCSDAVDAKDTVAILEIVAGLEEPATC